jgi:hypothetical protein
VMMVVAAASAVAVPAMMAVMRGCRVGSLRLGRIPIFSRCRLPGRSLPGRYKKQ